MKTLIIAEIVYLLSTWFEYLSISSAFKANQRQADKEGKMPLDKLVLSGPRISYSLSAFFGALALVGAYYLSTLVAGSAVYLVFTVSLIIGFLIRNVCYSRLSNWYYQYKQYQAIQAGKHSIQGTIQNSSVGAGNPNPANPLDNFASEEEVAKAMDRLGGKHE
ncbi:hypothetical protein GPK34_00460 [Secundilactobacillus kimchicus]|uniref:hypothetical protein n=1 Tax=Secundilactobacillus kimchicus TaxID=528209 RepID=UPI001C0202B6|nr:hypothetical protein [Secundilactobacillus kimchicus]MBT9670509.1 hypothetical protein [Secundilactobacillus kimchicus]